MGRIVKIICLSILLNFPFLIGCGEGGTEVGNPNPPQVGNGTGEMPLAEPCSNDPNQDPKLPPCTPQAQELNEAHNP